MAGIKFYTSPLSHNSLRVDMVLAEKNIEHEPIVVDLVKGEHKVRPSLIVHTSPEMLSKNPWGKVPVLECPHAGPMYESRPIARYLATVFADKSPSLLPSTDKYPAFARFEEGLAIEAQKLDADVTQLFFQLTHAPLMGMIPDQAVIEKSRKSVAATLAVVDGILSKQKYMGGETFSLADISFLPEFLALSVTGEDEAIKANPNVKRWWEEVSGRESWKRVSKPVWDVYTGIVAQVGGGK
ncbi:glutathione S-transferase [Rhizodiscina lignyota]|uniref:glutathione transferase n=1 Tax=Rhizodiscina lignyota TaxID=1504668 RepID=A0A9P4IMX5_9PEZI|nr:glutathione S-transferase [Rhizodiscina lignyota]